jgi:hypothetical protein
MVGIPGLFGGLLWVTSPLLTKAVHFLMVAVHILMGFVALQQTELTTALVLGNGVNELVSG